MSCGKRTVVENIEYTGYFVIAGEVGGGEVAIDKAPDLHLLQFANHSPQAANVSDVHSSKALSTRNICFVLLCLFAIFATS